MMKMSNGTTQIGDLARVRLDDGRIVFLGMHSSTELHRLLRRSRVGDLVSDGALEVRVCAADPYITMADGSLLVEEMMMQVADAGPRIHNTPRRVRGDRTGCFVRLRWTQRGCDEATVSHEEEDVEIGITPLPEPLEAALSELDIHGGAVGGEWYATKEGAAPRLGGAFRILPSPLHSPMCRELSDDDDADPSRWLSAAQSACDAGSSHASARRARHGLVVARERCAATSCGCLVLLSTLAARGVRPPPGEESSSDPAERLEHDAAALLYAERAVRASEGLGAAPAARAAHLRLATQCMRAGLWDRAAAALRGAADRGGDPRGSIAAHLRRCSARAARDHARERRMAMRMLSQRAP